MNLSRKEQFTGKILLQLGVCVAAVFAAGCGSGKIAGGNSQPSPPVQYNNYTGTQAYFLAQDGTTETGGVWTFALDDVNGFFTYSDIVKPINVSGGVVGFPLEGTTAAAGGFLKLSLTEVGLNTGGSKNGGYALEIPGRAAILRPGDNNQFPVVTAAVSTATSTSGCLSLPKTTYSFLMMAPAIYSQPPVYAVYGSVQASSSGTAWTFSGLQMFAADGTSLTPPTVSSGTCTYTTEGYVTYIEPSEATLNVPWTVVIGPSGYLVIDQGAGNLPPTQVGKPDGTEPLGIVGFPQPSSKIDTNSLVGANYLGFTFEPYNRGLGRPVTQPAAFSGGSGTAITGGAFPNDDPSQTAPANIAMDLGPEDSGTNGLYQSVTVAYPDLFNGCVGQPYGGKDANGNPTCIAHGVAIAGSVEGKYVLYVALQDHSLDTLGGTTSGEELEYFLYQQ